MRSPQQRRARCAFETEERERSGAEPVVQVCSEQARCPLALDGRTAEVRRLLEALERAGTGGCGLLYLAGAAAESVQLLGADGRVVIVSRRMAERLGYRAEELAGRPLTDLLFEEDVADHARRVENRRRGDAERYERRFRRKDGSPLWAVVSASPILDDARVFQGSISVTTDITELRHAESRIAELERALDEQGGRAAALVRANEELEAFSYSVSHDLRGPLRTLGGFAGLLRARHGTALDAQGRHYLDVVAHTALHMGQLVEDLLSFSRLSSGEMGMEDVDLRALAADVFDELRRSTPARAIRFELEALPPARCDRAMMRQVLTNLLDNAIKYTARRSEAVIRVRGARLGRELVYEVGDNGAGFDMRHADRLFGVFQRLHRADEFEGTGVGLAIVRRIVERHGGRVWAEAEVERGAAFHFTLPAPR